MRLRRPRAPAGGCRGAPGDEEVRWHLVHSDELWIWSGPGALEVHLGGSGDAPSADPRIVTLDSPASGQASDAANPVQILVPAGTWQRTFARGDYALADAGFEGITMCNDPGQPAQN